MRRALQTILVLALLGTAFSGVLSYQEIYGATAASCPAPGAPGTVFGYPACVYGLFMYLAIAVAAAVGLRAGSAVPDDGHESLSGRRPSAAA
jgi:uncharacterized membrane protein